MLSSMSIYFILLYFFVYGFLGWCTEVGFAAFKTHHFVNRGFLNGPICPIYGVGVTAVITVLTPYKSDIIVLYILSVVLVTVLEGVTGWAMDKIFHNKWWDYSDMPLNIGGYVCLLFSIVWGFACLFIIYFIQPLVHDLLAFIPTIVGIILIIILGITLIADLYVTASTIFKFNRRLAAMEKIAAEMHEISEQIGQEIFEKTIRAMDRQEASKEKLATATDEFKEKMQDTASGLKEKTQGTAFELKERALDARERSQEISEELRSRIASLHTRYHESTDKPGRISRRLMNAFPKMESHQYKESLEVLKKRWKR
ncbi:MAG: putative ABC transporter permease [Ruminococcus sp.]|uniref:putative ABC transporter permease n=1 Tax=Ruminococcus sp. TaxID=41978 RepID=UPI0039928D06